MRLVQTVAPTAQPLNLTDVKSYLRVLDNDSDSIINILIDSALNFAENYTGRQFLNATYSLTVARSELFQLQKTFYLNGYIEVNVPLAIPKAPFDQLVSIQASDINGVFTNVTSGYQIKYDGDVAKLVLTDQFSDRVDFELIFTCGKDSIPSSLQAWMLNKINTLFEYREALVDGRLTELPTNVIDSVLDQYKVRYL